MDLFCTRHPEKLLFYGLCDICASLEIKESFKLSGEKIQQQVSYCQAPAKTVLFNGKEIVYKHETSFIEYCVPAELESRIDEFLKSEVKSFESACLCAVCQSERRDEIR